MPKALKKKKRVGPDKLKIWPIALKICLILLLLIFIFILVYWPHINYPYPLHADEWMHLNNVASGNILYQEMGLYLFLYPISLIFNLLKIYQFLPAIWACVSALALFGFMLYLTKNYWISLLSMAFFSALKSNVNMMGTWFLVPFIFALPFGYLTLYFLDKGLEKKKMKFFIFAMLSMFYTIICHGSVGILIFAISTISLLIRFKELKKNKYGVLIFLGVPVLIGSIFILSLLPPEEILHRYIQGEWFGGLTPALSILRVTSIAAVATALVGAIFALQNKKQRVLVIWCIVCSIPVLLDIIGIHFLVRPQRAFYYLTIGMVPLSAIGLYNAIIMIKKRFNRIIAVVITIMLILLIFINCFYNYYNIDYQTSQPQRYNLNLYHGYNPELNKSIQDQLNQSLKITFRTDYSALEQLLNKSIIKVLDNGGNQ